MPTYSVPISQGGRRISHDPFTLCQDLQVLETRRRSEAFTERRKSDQFGAAAAAANQAGNRRRSSVMAPLAPPLKAKEKKKVKSFSMENVWK